MIEVDSFEHAGLTVKIAADEYVDGMYDPREHDNLAHLAISYRGYELGDEQLPRDGFAEIDCPVCEGGELVIHGPVLQRETMSSLGPVDDEPECPRCENFYTVEPTVTEWLEDRKAEVAAPLFIYEHSGMTIRAGSFRIIPHGEITESEVRSSGRFMGDDAGWDTSFVGFVYVTLERALELGIPGTTDGRVADWKALREAMIEQAGNEVNEYAQYLEGDCGGFVIENANGKILDSCWGFLGLRSEHLLESAKEAAEECRDEIEREKVEREHWAARDVITMEG